MAAAARHFPGLPLPYLLLAAFLHGLALFWLRPPLPAENAPATPPRLELQLVAPPAAPLPASASAIPPARTHRPAPAGGGARATGIDAMPTEAEAGMQPHTTAPAGTDLSIAARRFIREESRRHSGDPMYQPSRPSRSAPSPLGNATVRPSVGEKVLQEGVVKITNPDGSSYCLQRPPAVANRDGPVAVLSIPMTCPIAF